MIEIQVSPVYYGFDRNGSEDGLGKKRSNLIIFRQWKQKIKWANHSKNISFMSGVKIETMLSTGEQRFIPMGYPNEEEMKQIKKLQELGQQYSGHFDVHHEK